MKEEGSVLGETANSKAQHGNAAEDVISIKDGTDGSNTGKDEGNNPGPGETNYESGVDKATCSPASSPKRNCHRLQDKRTHLQAKLAGVLTGKVEGKTPGRKHTIQAQKTAMSPWHP